MRALILLVVCAAVDSQEESVALDAEWATFMKSFNKTYPTSEITKARRFIWEDNRRYIQKHNAEADLGKHTYHMGENQFSDLSFDEYQEQVKCFDMDTQTLSDNHNSSDSIDFANLECCRNSESPKCLPNFVDWIERGYVTDVKNQGHCKSCWAFSAAGSLEGQQKKKTGKLVALSEQQLVDCSKKYGNNGCRSGGTMRKAFFYIIDNRGIDSASSYPYEAKEGKCRFKRSKVAATVKKFVTATTGQECYLKWAVATVGPISAAFDGSHRSFQHYKRGIYYEPKCSSKHLTHAALVVGYGSFGKGKDYWLVKNSYGQWWGRIGYIYMSRNRKNNCGIASHNNYPIL